MKTGTKVKVKNGTSESMKAGRVKKWHDSWGSSIDGEEGEVIATPPGVSAVIVDLGYESPILLNLKHLEELK